MGLIGRLTAVATALALVVALGVGLGTAAGGGGGADAAKSKKFKPKKVAGSWKGTWKNQTFRTKGPATMDLTLKGKKKFTGVFDLGGNAFGCPDPEPREVTLKKGKGNNKWNKNGFKAVWSNDFGKNKLKFKAAKQKVVGSGVSPCTADIEYSYEGKMTNKKITAEVEITLEGEPFAESSLSMKKG